MNKFRIIGLTGPTGAGKSTVCRVFEAAGYGIVDTDALAREAVLPGTACLSRLAEVFSHEILNVDGTLNRRKLAQRAFQSAETQAQLNAITHPAILKLSDEAIKRLRATGKRGAVIDAPLLIESGMETQCDAVMVLLAPREMRIARLLKRDGVTREEIERRMAVQKSDAFYIEKADAVVYNTGELRELEQQVKDQLCRWEAGDV